MPSTTSMLFARPMETRVRPPAREPFADRALKRPADVENESRMVWTMIFKRCNMTRFLWVVDDLRAAPGWRHLQNRFFAQRREGTTRRRGGSLHSSAAFLPGPEEKLTPPGYARGHNSGIH